MHLHDANPCCSRLNSIPKPGWQRSTDTTPNIRCSEWMFSVSRGREKGPGSAGCLPMESCKQIKVLGNVKSYVQSSNKLVIWQQAGKKKNRIVTKDDWEFLRSATTKNTALIVYRKNVNTLLESTVAGWKDQSSANL